MQRTTIFKLVSLAGTALGGIGTVLSAWASNKELDTVIDEKLDERLADREDEEDIEES